MNMEEFKAKWAEQDRRSLNHTVITKTDKFWANDFEHEGNVIKFYYGKFVHNIYERREVATELVQNILEVKPGKHGVWLFDDEKRTMKLLSWSEYQELRARQKELEQKIKEDEEKISFMQLEGMREPY